MNSLSRSLSRIVYSSLHPPRILPSRQSITRGKWVISRRIHFVSPLNSGRIIGGGTKLKAQVPAKSVAVAEAEKELARPREIAYQSEVANWVNLIGFIDQPVQFEASSDGKFWAGTVISQRSGSGSSSSSDPSAFWIPIIFEGDLARIAARYLKKNDQIHISGKLFIDSPPPNLTCVQANVQVMVQNLNFVHTPSPATTNLSSENQGVPKKGSSRATKVTEEASVSWRDLLDNPKEWWDYRDNKKNGLLKPRHPEFKRKDGGLSLWLDKAPKWVLSKLEGVEFDIPVIKTKQTKQHKGDESWKDLVENPEKWWDNRSGKKNVKSPDFKHKETGEALWLNGSPSWVLSKLPPLNKNHLEETIGKKGKRQC